ncbi:hypothetical protein HK100_010656 [Physocladia obscura]|uniref:Uncharacterized protein n=1 Tax=Physocladia obscura TaxID=109957 RepID=A0AAD5XHG0_9FUNG|nr:hypothetical protein HK100_010656 [Physocladia obscura]
MEQEVYESDNNDDVQLLWSPVSASAESLLIIDEASPAAVVGASRLSRIQSLMRASNRNSNTNSKDIQNSNDINYIDQNNPDDDVVFFDSPPESPSGFDDNASYKSLPSKSRASTFHGEPRFDLSSQPSFRRHLDSVILSSETTNQPISAKSLNDRTTYLEYLQSLRSEIANSGTAHISIPAKNQSVPNTSFMVLASTHVENPSFEPPSPIYQKPPQQIEDGVKEKRHNSINLNILKHLSIPIVNHDNPADDSPSRSNKVNDFFKNHSGNSSGANSTNILPTKRISVPFFKTEIAETQNETDSVSFSNPQFSANFSSSVEAQKSIAVPSAQSKQSFGLFNALKTPANSPQSTSSFKVIRVYPENEISDGLQTPVIRSPSKTMVSSFPERNFAEIFSRNEPANRIPIPVIRSANGTMIPVVPQRDVTEKHQKHETSSNSSFRVIRSNMSTEYSQGDKNNLPTPVIRSTAGTMTPVNPSRSFNGAQNKLPTPVIRSATGAMTPILTNKYPDEQLLLSALNEHIYNPSRVSLSKETNSTVPIEKQSNESTNVQSLGKLNSKLIATEPNDNQDIKTTAPSSPSLRKGPPAPKLPKKKKLNLDIKFEFAKLCIEGSVLYGTDMEEVQRLKDEGYEYLQELSVEQMPEANFYLGKCFAEDGNYKLAFPAFLQAAKSGHPEACYAAASCLEYGRGCDVSMITASYYYKTSAEAGYLLAMYRMATALFSGELSLPRNIYIAFDWLEKCAHYPSREPVVLQSMFQLSEIYELGTISNQSPILARQYLENAASDGTYAPAVTKLAYAYEHGLYDLPSDVQKSIALYKRAAELKEPYAMYVMADFFLRGVTLMTCGCSANYIENFENYDESIYSSPLEEEMVDVWDIKFLNSNTSVPIDISLEKSKENITNKETKQHIVLKPVQKSHDEPCTFVILIEQDVGKAIGFINAILQSPNAGPRLRSDAQYALGYLYENLPDVKDLGRAMLFYESASRAGNIMARKKVKELREGASSAKREQISKNTGNSAGISVGGGSGKSSSIGGGFWPKVSVSVEDDKLREAFREYMAYTMERRNADGGNREPVFGIVKQSRAIGDAPGFDEEGRIWEDFRSYEDRIDERHGRRSQKTGQVEKCILM